MEGELWAAELEITKPAADILFFARYGNLLISPFVYERLTNGVLTDAARKLIATLLQQTFSYKWAKINGVFIATYEKFNYNNSTVKVTETKTNTTNYGKTNTINSSENVGIYGFNSDSATNSDTITSEKTSADSGTDGNNSTGSRTEETKGGNIPAAEILEKELSLWNKNFIDTILKDVATILATPVYGGYEK